MKAINNILKSLAYSNVIVALSATSLAASTYLYLSFFDLYYLAFVFCSTIFVYNFARFFEGESEDFQKSPITIWHIKHRRWIWISTLMSAALSLLFAYLSFDHEKWLLAILSGGIALSYPLGLRFRGMNITLKPLRESPGIKLVAIGWVWMIICGLLPFLDAWHWEGVLYLVGRFLFVVGITIPFDIRDYNIDSKQMWTLPMVWGKKNAWRFSMVLVSLGALLAVSFAVIMNHPMKMVFAELLSTLLTLFLLYGSKKITSDIYYSVAIESTTIFLFFSLYLFSYI